VHKYEVFLLTMIGRKRNDSAVAKITVLYIKIFACRRENILCAYVLVL